MSLTFFFTQSQRWTIKPHRISIGVKLLSERAGHWISRMSWTAVQYLGPFHWGIQLFAVAKFSINGKFAVLARRQRSSTFHKLTVMWLDSILGTTWPSSYQVQLTSRFKRVFICKCSRPIIVKIMLRNVTRATLRWGLSCISGWV